MKTLSNIGLVITVLLSVVSCKQNETSTDKALLAVNAESIATNSEIKSANILEFGDNNILFLGDSKTGAVYAIETQTGENKTKGYGYNLNGFDKKVAKFLKLDNDDILFKDLATHPKSGEAYVSLSVIQNGTYVPVVLIANQSGELRKLDLSNAKYTKLQLPNTPAEAFKFWDDINARSLTITDMDFHKGKLYISGLSNKDFASTLRVADYPFNNKVAVSNIEIFHTNHAQMETRAPIRTMTISNLNGKDYVLAAYTCTPLVTIPLEDLKDGAKVSGKTISELGYGNTPVDLIPFTAQDWNKNQFEVVLLNNKNQSAQLIPVAKLEEGNGKEGMKQFMNFQKGGVAANDLPLTGIMQMADLDGYHLLTLRRDVDNGDVELVSFMKNMYFRVSDFQSEFEFPDYKYAKEGEQIKQIQNMMKKDEGFAAKVVE